MDINSENYNCVANHTDFSYPTTLKPPPWWSSRKLRGNYIISKKKKSRIETAPASATNTTTKIFDLLVQRPPLFGPTPPPPPQVGIPVTEYEFLKQLLVDFTSEHDAIQQKLLLVQQESDSKSQVILKQQEQILRADTTIETNHQKIRSLTAKSHRTSLRHNRTIQRLVEESLQKNFYLSPNNLTTRAVNSFASPNQPDSLNSSVRRDSVTKVAARCKLYVENILLQEQSLFDNHLRVATVNAVCKILREDKFTAFNFLYTMDAHGHVLSLKAISVIRQMQELNKFSRHYLCFRFEYQSCCLHHQAIWQVYC
jgi:hypothetical protein